MRSILFHAGGPKTGSSALQTFFHDNADRLRRKGVSYENSWDLGHTHAVGNGNGALLAEAVRSSSEDLTALAAQVATYFYKSQRQALISSEIFGQFSVEHWQRLREACDRAEASMRVVFYVRDVYPFFVSAFHQAVKGHGISEPFATFVKELHFDYHADMVRRAVQVVGRENCLVQHYESRRRALEIPILSALGLKGDFDRAALTRRINRRLTERELFVLRSVNAELGSHYSTEISRSFIYNRPNEPTPEALDAEVLRLVVERHTACVVWLNETFFDSEPVVQILAPSAAAADAGAERVRYDDWADTPEAQVAEWAVKRLDRDRQTYLDELRDRIARLVRDRTYAADPGLPPDFDPCAYLLLNEDLLRHEVPPYEHYLRNGKEEGRAYRF